MQDQEYEINLSEEKEGGEIDSFFKAMDEGNIDTLTEVLKRDNTLVNRVTSGLKSEESDAEGEISDAEDGILNPKDAKPVFGALFLAVQFGDIDIFKLILGRNPENMNTPFGFFKRTAIFEAVSSCREEMVELLLAKGADITIKSVDDHTIFREAVLNYNHNILTMLLGSVPNEPQTLELLLAAKTLADLRGKKEAVALIDEALSHLSEIQKMTLGTKTAVTDFLPDPLAGIVAEYAAHENIHSFFKSNSSSEPESVASSSSSSIEQTL